MIPIKKPIQANLGERLRAAFYPEPQLKGTYIELGFRVGCLIANFGGSNSPRLVPFEEVLDALHSARCHHNRAVSTPPYERMIAAKCLPVLEQITHDIREEISFAWTKTEILAAASAGNSDSARHDLAKALAPSIPKLIKSLQYDISLHGADYGCFAAHIRMLQSIMKYNGNVIAQPRTSESLRPK